MIENIKENIKHKFSVMFTPDDSVVIFDVNIEKTIKYGNAIHRDKDLFFFNLHTISTAIKVLLINGLNNSLLTCASLMRGGNLIYLIFLITI